MTEDKISRSGQIKNAVSALRKLRPAYAELLDFYEPIFIAQEEAGLKMDHLKLEDYQMKTEKNERDFPILSASIDVRTSTQLLRKLCEIAEDANKDMAIYARNILKGLDTGKIDPNDLFHNFLKDKSSFEKISGRLEIDKEVFIFMIYNSIKPCLIRYTEQISMPSDKEPEKTGRCPICGSLPSLSTLEGEGGRFLLCSFCLHKWSVPRMFCPFCEKGDHDTLHYFYTEEEKEYRVDMCDTCKTYVKTVDIRKMERIFYPPLEQIATLHLDMKAAEMGFFKTVETSPGG